MNVEVDPNEDTEWNDILRSHGVIPERAPSPSAQMEEAMNEAMQEAYDNRLEHKTVKELDEIDEDGLEDEAFIEQYRQKRLAELQELASKEKYGYVKVISKPEYTEEITDSSKNDQFVFVHISYTGVVQSKLLAGLFDRLAPKFRDLKFVQIDARQVNERYPQETCPTILVYKNTEVIKQVITLTGIGGNSCNMRDIEQVLVDCGAVNKSDRRLTVNADGSDSGSDDSESDDDL